MASEKIRRREAPAGALFKTGTYQDHEGWWFRLEGADFGPYRSKSAAEEALGVDLAWARLARGGKAHN